MKNKADVSWAYQTADKADDKIEGHKEWCVLYPSFSSPPPLSAPDRGDAGSRVFVMGCDRGAIQTVLTGNVFTCFSTIVSVCLCAVYGYVLDMCVKDD